MNLAQFLGSVLDNASHGAQRIEQGSAGALNNLYHMVIHAPLPQTNRPADRSVDVPHPSRSVFVHPSPLAPIAVPTFNTTPAPLEGYSNVQIPMDRPLPNFAPRYGQSVPRGVTIPTNAYSLGLKRGSA